MIDLVVFLCCYVDEIGKCVFYALASMRASLHTNVACVGVCVDVSGLTSEICRSERERERYKRIDISRGLCSFLSVLCDLPPLLLLLQLPERRFSRYSFTFLYLLLLLFVLSFVFTFEKFLFYFFTLKRRLERLLLTKAERETSFMCTIFSAFFSFCFPFTSRKTITGPIGFFCSGSVSLVSLSQEPTGVCCLCNRNVIVSLRWMSTCVFVFVLTRIKSRTARFRNAIFVFRWLGNSLEWKKINGP